MICFHRLGPPRIATTHHCTALPPGYRFATTPPEPEACKTSALNEQAATPWWFPGFGFKNFTRCRKAGIRVPYFTGRHRALLKFFEDTEKPFDCLTLLALCPLQTLVGRGNTTFLAGIGLSSKMNEDTEKPLQLREFSAMMT